MTQQILILVGPDRCGKTNIAAELSRLTCIPVFKASSEHRAFLGDQRSFLNDLKYADPRLCDFIKQTNASVILDRSWPCEKVYSEFFKRKTDKKALKYIDAAYASVGAKVVVCTRKSFVGIQDDLDKKLDEKALTTIAELYQKFTSWTKCQTYTLYVDDENLERQTTEIIQFMGYSSETQEKLRYWSLANKSVKELVQHV